MKTFTDEQIKDLAKRGRISGKDQLAILLQAKEAIEKTPAAETSEEAAILAGIRDILALIATKIPQSQEKVLTVPAPIVTMTMPKRGDWTATVMERDNNGFIKRVTFKEAAP